jgi:hypothetical protein
MIFGIILILFCSFLLLLDYAHIFQEKRRKLSFYAECVIWIIIFQYFGSDLFENHPLYSDGGVRIDLVTLLFLSREAILARIARSESIHDFTVEMRKQAVLRVIKIEQVELISLSVQSLPNP